VGMDHGGVGISFLLVIGEPGRGMRLHKHDYDGVRNSSRIHSASPTRTEERAL
jgi:hypothetical protein